MISRLIATFHKLQFEPTAEEIADMLWLALQMHPDIPEQADSEIQPDSVEEPEQPPPIDGADGDKTYPGPGNSVDEDTHEEEETRQDESPAGKLYLSGPQQDDGHDSASSGSKPFKSPGASALPHALDLSRALRPLMRRVPSRTRKVFDAKATVYAIAQQYLAGQDTWIPIEHPARERWLEVALVVDESRSMNIWHRTIMELQTLLERQGAFRDVRTWGLVADSDEQHIHLHAGIGLLTGKRQMRAPAELIDATGRRLILVVSDCVSTVWRNGVVADALVQWGCHGPLAIMQVLPARLWGRTGLGLETEAYIHASLAGVPNIQLAYEPSNQQLKTTAQTRRMPVPVIPLTPLPLRHWARAIAGGESQWIAGYLFAPRTKEPIVVPEEVAEQPAPEPPTAEQRIQRFRAIASPTARQLVGLLAAAPISLPVARIVQNKLLPRSEQGHIAEVFLGGLLEQLPSTTSAMHPDYVQYDFVEGVRDLLLNAMPIEESLQVLKEVSDFVAAQYGSTFDFRALLADPTSQEGQVIDEASKPFARVAAQILSRIGGDYAPIAHHLELVTSARKKPARMNGSSSKEATSVIQRSLGEEFSADDVSGTEEFSADDVRDIEEDVSVEVVESSDYGQVVKASSNGGGKVENIYNAENIHIHTISNISHLIEFYISYTSFDSEWAEWITWQLEEAGYTVVLPKRDFRPGSNLDLERVNAIENAKRILFVLSPNYFNNQGALSELDHTLELAAKGQVSLFPVLVQQIDPDMLGPLKFIVYLNLVGLDEATARKALLEGVRLKPERTKQPPNFPVNISTIATSPPITRESSEISIPAFPDAKRLSTGPIEVFLVHADEDQALVNELRLHLRILERQRLIAVWSDTDIFSGVEREDEIAKHLETAGILLLMVSPSFMASDEHYEYMIRALQRHEADEARVIPVILRPVYWSDTLFHKLQVFPHNGKPVTTWENQDEAMLDITQGIHSAIEQIRSGTIAPIEQAEQPFERQPELPTFWNVPYARNPFFTGRDEIIETLYKGFTSSRSALRQPQAISGLGGIGKTQIAIEYAYRHSNNYGYVLWARADTTETLVADFSACAELLGLPRTKDEALFVNTFKRWLNDNYDWLLILDNADDLAMVRNFLPSNGRGHILLTTRAQATRRLARQVLVDTLSLDAGAVFLLKRAGIIARDDAQSSEIEQARGISQMLGGLPLALDQAAAYIEETASGLSDYLRIYQEHSMGLLRRRGSIISDHPEPVATVWSLSFQQIEAANSAAADLLRFCSFLAPEAIPIELITSNVALFDPPLSYIADNGFELEAALGEILKFSLLARDRTNNTLMMHCLVQTVFRGLMARETQRYWAKCAIKAVNNVFPSGDFTTWAQCQRLLPHVYACMDLVNTYKFALHEAARICSKAGFYLYNLAQFSEAEALMLVALDIDTQIKNSDLADTVRDLNNLGKLYLAQGKYAKAESLLQRALSLSEDGLPSEYPSLVYCFNNLGELYLAQGKYDQALSHFEQAIARDSSTLPADQLLLASCFNNMGKLYLLQSEYNDVEVFLQGALKIHEEALPADHPDLASSLNNMGRLYWLQQKYEEAEHFLLRALAIDEKALPSDHPDIARGCNNLGVFYFMENKFDEAEIFTNRAVGIYAQKLGVEHPSSKIAVNNYGLVHNLFEQDEAPATRWVPEML